MPAGLCDQYGYQDGLDFGSVQVRLPPQALRLTTAGILPRAQDPVYSISKLAIVGLRNPWACATRKTESAATRSAPARSAAQE